MCCTYGLLGKQFTIASHKINFYTSVLRYSCSIYSLDSTCYNECMRKIAYQKGTFVVVRHHCSYCGNQRVQRSQPHIKNTPAGNILLSAAILFSGATPGKILQLTCGLVPLATELFIIIRASIFNLLYSVWETKQQKLLAQCRSLGTPVSVD